MNIHENIIPSGNVTFLFTDIEGSTKLSQEFPDTLPAALKTSFHSDKRQSNPTTASSFKTLAMLLLCVREFRRCCQSGC
ncbi:MAG: hypothetical protein IPG02_15515 [Ignavibacteria bacterium]|nr:hypothetical protein [Ignavibacteria bacterium]